MILSPIGFLTSPLVSVGYVGMAGEQKNQNTDHLYYTVYTVDLSLFFKHMTFKINSR